MRSQQYEQILNHQKVEWSYIEKLELSAINVEKSANNQARISQPIIPELQEIYKEQLSQGMEPPALVGWKQKSSGDHILIDGNNRLHSMLDFGIKHHDYYQVDTEDPMVIDRLTWRWNQLTNGQRLKEEEDIRHALSYMQKYNLTAKQTAEIFSRSVDSIHRALRTEKVRAALRKFKIKGVEDLSDDLVGRLSPILTMGEDLLGRATKIIISNGMANKRDVGEIIGTLQSATTTTAKIVVLEQLEAGERAKSRRAATQGGKHHIIEGSPSEKLFRQLKAMYKLFLDFSSKDSFYLVDGDYQRAKEMVIPIVSHLTRIFELWKEESEENGKDE